MPPPARAHQRGRSAAGSRGVATTGTVPARCDDAGFSKADRLEIKGRSGTASSSGAMPLPPRASSPPTGRSRSPTSATCQPGFNVTVRYQVVEGNLGKVDHILVLMMENRSFDHMLGYRKLTDANGDVDGLTGNEINHDDNNASQQVHRLTATNFVSDPGHGWTDVAGALPGTTLSTTAHRSS